MKRYAIIISCEEYVEYPNISFCHADNMLMQETLCTYCDYEYNNLLSLTLYPGSEFNNPNDILSKIKEIINKSKNGDTILFYFAGHGLFFNNNAYLLLPDTRASNIEDTSISISKLNNCLSENGRCNFRIFDACHSGFDSRGYNSNSFTDIVLQQGWITLASCSKDEHSYPDSALEQGIFTYCLSKSIKEFNSNDLIYAEELKIKICNKMLTWCKKNHKKQTPTMNASVTGNMPLAQRVEVNDINNINLNQVTALNTIAATSNNNNLGGNMTNNNNNNITDLTLLNNNSKLLWESPSGIVLPKKADVPTILNYNIQLKPKEIIQITHAYNSEFYEMTAEFIWTRAINLLRKKVLSLGVDFVSDMIEINNHEYICNLPPFEVINLAYELGFINKLGRLRLKNNSEIIQIYSDRDINEEMTEEQVKEIIRTCIQYILGQDDSNLNLEYNNFRDRLKLEQIDKTQLDMILNSPYFYKKTTTRTLMNLLKETDGAEFSNVSSNILEIIPHIWQSLLSEEKYFIATSYAKYANDGNNKYISVLKNLLMKVQGFDYVPENLKSLTFIEAAKRLISTHYDINNFYNEPKAVKNLSSLGTIIPKPALKVVIDATLLIKMGNSYGISWGAQEYADKILDSIHSEQWRSYLDSQLSSSEYVLQKICCNDDRTTRWMNIVEKYDLNTLDITNPLIRSLLDKSIAKRANEVSSIANKLYNKLRN
ncbi:hypothetical protein Z967_10680 [Clostridium novyi A str. 4540]|uniref:caspase family protein n=1 Tax=Clostridium novyi TaxID=1542 RepID=UPI0004D92B54|nr:caspase family protein [Clostridium novyi]KEH89317.1 hypothetical protein Z967_10680 [Clostridium novyi A str. 4540]